MRITKSHTLKLVIAALLLYMTGEYAAKAQELLMPERWASAIMTPKPLFSPDTLTIRILGDVMMHSAQIANARGSSSEYDFSSYFHLIEDKIRDADIAIANMEFTLAGDPYTGYPCFSAPDALPVYMAECGTDVFLAANNHIFDKGTTGAERTIMMYRSLQQSMGIRFTGLAGNEEEMRGNNPLMIRAKGFCIAILNFTYGTNLGLGTAWPRTNYIGEKEKISDAFNSAISKSADYIIALPHWGIEYKLKHSKTQEEFAIWLAEQGADCIIGAHPHVVQDIGTIGDVPVAYSLGNAVSNMSAPDTQLELMATIRLTRNENGDVHPLPLELDYLWCSRPGGYNDRYTIIPLSEYIGRQDEWLNQSDYQKMIATYNRVSKETGIQ